MKKAILAGVGTLALAAGIGLAACGGGSSSPSTSSGTETLHGVESGSAAAASLNSASGNLVFPTFTWSGVVNTTAHNINLGGGSSGSEHTFKTSVGSFTVKHYSPASEKNGGPISLTGPASGACTFTQHQSGTYTVIPGKSTDSFAGAVGHGDYSLVITASGPAAGGKCVMTNNGPSVTKLSTASIAFTAHGPLTVGG